MSKTVINIVVYQPENSGNLGNIIRSCYIYGAKLHLIRPYGWVGNLRYFHNELNNTPQAQLVRAAVDCFDKIEINEYDQWTDFYNQINDQNQIAFLTKFGGSTLDQWLTTSQVSKDHPIYLIFGSETFGLTKLAEYFDFSHLNQVQLGGLNSDKSHNLANAVAISLHLVWIKLSLSGL